MKIERHDIAEHPEHGRPRILTIEGKEGALHVHVERERGTLFIYAIGPMGGDRGRVVIGAPRAHEVRQWLRSGERPLYGGDGVYLWLTNWRDERIVRMGKSSVSSKVWRMVIDDEAEAVLRECLTAWADQASVGRVDGEAELQVLVKLDADAPVPREEVVEFVKARLESSGWKNEGGFVVVGEVTVT